MLPATADELEAVAAALGMPLAFEFEYRCVIGLVPVVHAFWAEFLLPATVSNAARDSTEVAWPRRPHRSATELKRAATTWEQRRQGLQRGDRQRHMVVDDQNK